MTPDRKLQALFAEDAPPARDYAFEAAVAQRVARRRAVLSVVAMIPWAIVAACVLWGLRPVVAPLGEVLSRFDPVVGAIASALSLTVVAVLTARRAVRR